MIWIPASSLAGFTGQHHYVPQHEAFLELWVRHDPECAALLRAMGECTASSRKRKAAARICREVHDVAQHTANISSGSTVQDRAESEASMVEAVARSASSPRTQRDAVAALRSRAFVQRGVRDEATILDAHQDEEGEEVVERNARTYELVLESDSHGIRGRVDGVTATHVIEAKRRMRRFFERVPLYERVQVHAYMAMTDKKAARVVQHFDGEQRQDEIEFDELFWDDVKSRSARAVKWLRESMELESSLKSARIEDLLHTFPFVE